MEPAQNNYPLFEANQVLSSRHLNDLFSYLDEQERLTRTNLIGIGIVCGLEITFDKQYSTIHLSKGCGITSKGFLIDIPDILLVSYRDYTITDISGYSEFKNTGGVQYQLRELCSAEEQNTTLLNDLHLSDYVVLLFLELTEQPLRNCSPKNCDSKGSQVIVNVKPLLIEKNDLDKIIESANKLSNDLTSGNPEKTFLQRLGLSDIRLPRFNVLNTEPVTTNDIYNAFRKVFATGFVSSTAEALHNAYKVFKPILQKEYPTDPFGSFIEKFGFLDNAPQTNEQIHLIQYYYDFFSDLIQAYDEFRWKGVELVCACCPPEGLFPHHLMLGALCPDDQGVYRQNFLASNTLSACSEGSREVVQLFMRMLEMTLCFNLTELANTTDIRITPSSFGDRALSDTAIPYYYQQAGSTPLYKLWSYEKTKRNRSHLNLGYRFDDYKNLSDKDYVYVSNPLSYNLEPYNFFRIEGHLGQKQQEVLQWLLLKISEYRLPIDVVVLRTGNIAASNSLNKFLKKHPGVQHKSGVLLGGTFVLVYHDDDSKISGIDTGNIIADFYLPYRINEPEIIQSVTVKECEYKWIDTVRHLNNLSLRNYRNDLKPTSQEYERSRLKESYVLRIYAYDIQGISLLTGKKFVDLVIPINSIKNFRFSIIAQLLNEKFPFGLVFDHNPLINNVIVRFIAGHKFRIELGGIQGNQIRYAYTQNGMYRLQNNSWEELTGKSDLGFPCHIAGGKYNEKEYQWLHEKFPPAPLTQASVPTAKEVIEWEKLTLIRSRQYKKAELLPISSILSEIVTAVRCIDQNASITLVGSWANGSWVSRNEEKNIKSFATEADKQLFLALRKKVTGKTGYSDIDLLIDSEQEISTHMIRVSTGYPITFLKGKKDAQKGLVL